MSTKIDRAKVYRFTAKKMGRVDLFGADNKWLGALPKFTHVKNHSRKFSWGLLLPGQSNYQLALAMCCMTLGEEIGCDPKIYKEFKLRVIDRMNPTWSLLVDDVRQLPLFATGGNAYEEW